jgi:hypothetical protein
MDNKEKIYLSVISNGDPTTSYVVDQDGRRIEGVVDIQYKISALDRPQLILTLIGASVNISDNLGFGDFDLNPDYTDNDNFSFEKNEYISSICDLVDLSDEE